MKKESLFFVIGLFFACNSFISCKSKQPIEISPVVDTHSSRNSLDWAGTYTGVIPCADCNGIETRITLHENGSYRMIQVYRDKEGVFETKGNFKWNEAGSMISLFEDDRLVNHFFVGEDKLIQRDMDGNEITGQLQQEYILVKINPLLTDKKWKLVELSGNPVEGNAFFVLKAEDGSMSGSLGCNSFTGTYDLKIGSRIEFSRMASTLKMCLDMKVEDELKRVFEVADNYFVSEKFLVLNRARMAPLAKFVPAK